MNKDIKNVTKNDKNKKLNEFEIVGFLGAVIVGICLCISIVSVIMH